jgi:type IV secretory pathway VirB10-like protein
MEVNKATIIAIATLCAAAGAGGAYLTTRIEPAVDQRSVVDEVTTSPGTADPNTADLGAADLDIVSGRENGSDNPASASSRPAEVRTSAPLQRPRPKATRDEVRRSGSVNESRGTEGPRSPAQPPVATQDPSPDHGASVPLDAARTLELSPAGPVEPLREDLIVPAQAVIGLQFETSVSSETAVAEDEVIARVTRDVRVHDQIAVPAGSKVQGFVTLVERGGRLRERARLGVRFTTLILPDGSRLPIDTETIYREGESATRESATKIGGGAIGGAIIGGLLGGAKGAAIGSSIGAGTGTAMVMTGGRNAAVLNPNTPITVRLEQPVAVANERERR